MKKNFGKRLFSTVLAGLTAASMLPVTAMAETDSVTTSRGIIYYIDNGGTEDVAVTDDYEGNLYHIDIIVLGTLEYELGETTEYNKSIMTISKSWNDNEDHSDQTVVVNLMNEDEEYIYNDDGEIATVELTASDNWEYSFENDEYEGKVYYVEEAAVIDEDGDEVTGYASSVNYDWSSSSEEEAENEISGTITVTGINSVEYTYVEDGEKKTQSISSEYYYENSDVNRSDQEFFCGTNNDVADAEEVVRRLGTNETTYGGPYGQLTTDSTITINLTYTFTYKDEDGNEVTSEEITNDFEFDAGKQNACGYVVNYIECGYYQGSDGTDTLANDGTLAGYDALITATDFVESVINNIYNRTATITNSPSSSGDSEEGETEEKETEEKMSEEEKSEEEESEGEESEEGSEEEESEGEESEEGSEEEESEGEESKEEPEEEDDSSSSTTETTTTVTTTETTTTTATASACLAIIKEDADTGAYLEGAVYALYSAYDDSLIGYYATNEEGWLSTYPMSSGTYYFVETQAPDGYELDATPVYVTLDASSGETLVTVVTNTAVQEVLAAEVEEPIVETVEEVEAAGEDPAVVLGESRGAGTGDDSNLLFWLILMLAAGAGIGGVVLVSRRNHA